jgi:hypothetical protein
MTGRPILALAHHGSLLADLLGQLRCTELVRLLVPGRLTAPPREVAEFLARAAQPAGPARQPRNDDWFDRHCTARAGTRRQCELFDSLVPGVT